ncbi:MAG: TolC family protein [Chitinophagaceae bacterium]|nr:MAG: TolC family protein [Chitinophagaceae bacterium]
MKKLKYIYVIGAMVSLQSCFVAKPYTRPNLIEIQDQFYRSNELNKDSLSTANLSWKELFKDEKLQNYIQKALDNNIDIRIALQNINSAQAYLKQGKSAYFPSINAGVNYSFANPSLNGAQGKSLNDRQNINQYEWSTNLSWEADIWGKLKSNERAINASYLQSISVHQAIKSQLVAAIASSYYQLLAFDEQKRITEKTIQNREQSNHTIRLLKDAGNVTEVAVKQTEAQLLSAKSLLLDIENNIKLLENSFCILLGENLQEINRGKLGEQLLSSQLNTGVPIQLLSNRPDVMAAEYGLINAFELTNVARSNFYPSLKISASGGVQSLNFESLFNANALFASLIGSLTQPLLNGRQIKTQYEVRKAQQEIALLNYKKSILNSSKEVADALYTYQTNDKKAILKKLEFEAYEKATSYSEELLTNGFANYLEVLTARESALNAQLNVVNATFGKMNAIVQLYKSLGGGWR